MKIIEPVQPDAATLTASSIAESTVPLWDGGTAYTIGDTARAFSEGAYHIFESLIDGADQDPTQSPVDGSGNPYWLDTGATNRWAMFDGSVGSPSTDSAEIVVEYEPGRRINSLALFNVTASSVRVEGMSAVAGGSVYDKTINSVGTRGGGWYNWSFGEVVPTSRYQFFGIPPFPDIVIKVTISPASGTASVGEMVFGNEFNIGTDEQGMEPRIKDYSTNEFNSTFGYNTLIKRKTRRRLTAYVVIPEGRSDSVFNKLESLASVRVVWISDKYESGTIYGFYSDYTPTYSSHPLVFATIKIEGLV